MKRTFMTHPRLSNNELCFFFFVFTFIVSMFNDWENRKKIHDLLQIDPNDWRTHWFHCCCLRMGIFIVVFLHFLSFRIGFQSWPLAIRVSITVHQMPTEISISALQTKEQNKNMYTKRKQRLKWNFHQILMIHRLVEWKSATYANSNSTGWRTAVN